MNKKKYTTPEPERWEEMLRAALDLARLGIPVFPVHGVLLGANGPVCTCGATGDGHSEDSGGFRTPVPDESVHLFRAISYTPTGGS